MRAVVAAEAGGPDVLSVDEVDDVAAGPGEVLVRVAAAGLNRADLLQRQGRYAHSTAYVTQAVEDAGFRTRILRSEPARFEADVPVPGLLVVLERTRHDS